MVYVLGNPLRGALRYLLAHEARLLPPGLVGKVVDVTVVAIQVAT
jgi:hypothetical protein